MLAWQLGGSGGSPSRIFFRFIPGAKPIYLPCGKCIGCRLERSRQWAIRCVHEAQLHEHNCFITLTYDNDHLPINNSLLPRDLTLFFKRLRKNVGQCRYFACGEYGDRNKRPHYHACIFGLDFSDDLRLQTVEDDTGIHQFAVSPKLQSLWTFGHSQVGKLTFESAAYVARYCLKKHYGDPVSVAEHYKGRIPEYVVMSRRPGIGKNWLDKYFDQTYPRDGVLCRGQYMSKPPRYYDKILQLENEQLYNAVKKSRESENFEIPDSAVLMRQEEFMHVSQSKIHRR